jgi:tetratricopeptide (TPR) repeat protein
MNSNNVMKWGIMTGLWAVLLIPFFVANGMFFPYITGKNFTFRIIVEIIFALWVYLAFIDAKYRPRFSWVSVSVGVFVLVMALADILALNPMKALWSNYERMDGFITLIHLLMYLMVFGSIMKSKQNWTWFFRSSVLASMGMIVFVIQEWTKTGIDRVSVTLGNPIYVAVYFMFNFFFALILLYQDVIAKSDDTPKPLKTIFTNWLYYAYILAIFVCAFGIWRTSTRGVILGLLGGLIIASIIIALFEKKNKFVKNSSIGGLAIIILLIGGFVMIKNTQFVKNNVTLSRLAEVSWSSVSGSGQARQYVWPMALKGAMDQSTTSSRLPYHHLILGWGQDGFNNIFNKYYDVRMYNQEQWFDRAHNTPLDVLVAGGILGLLAYLLIFVSAIFVVHKKKDHFSVTEAGLIIGLLAAYFAQNLFVFDNLVSYIFFYVVLAYLYSRDTHGEHIDKRVVTEDIANYVVLPIVLIMLAVTLWYGNIKPINANHDLISAMQTIRQSPETSLTYFKQIFESNTFGNSEAREQLVSMAPSIANASGIDTKVKGEFVDLAFTQMQEQIKETPNDARYQFFMGTFLNNMNQFQTALPYLQKAVELSPNKLTMMFELAKGYAYLGQKDKALEVAKRAYDLVPEYTDGKMNYAAALILNDRESEAKQIMGVATTTNENIVRMYLIKASAFVQKGDKNSAVTEVQKAIDIAPGFKDQGEKVIKGIWDGSIK